jgi:hypothetical protein
MTETDRGVKFGLAHNALSTGGTKGGPDDYELMLLWPPKSIHAVHSPPGNSGEPVPGQAVGRGTIAQHPHAVAMQYAKTFFWQTKVQMRGNRACEEIEQATIGNRSASKLGQPPRE